jgi:diguanylate cyclase (GGDEF)-like protein
MPGLEALLQRRRLKHFSLQTLLKGARLVNPLMQSRARVMLVEDDPFMLKALTDTLGQDWNVEPLCCAAEALESMNDSVPDLLISDIMMPGMSGIDLLTRVRSNPSTATLPVLLLSAVGDCDTIVKALELGANDFINKPVNPMILKARINSLLRTASMQAKLETQNAMLAKLAAFDELTGIYNRRSMLDALESEVSRSTRYDRPMSVLLLDIDHFKHVNDRYGHLTGDKVLQAFVDRVASLLRNNDIFCRYGGEEFCIIMPDTPQQNASSAAERIRYAIEQEEFRIDDETLHLTTCIGLSCLKKGFDGQPESLISDADKALYDAKQGGRNQVRIYSHEDCQVAD